MEEAAGPGGVVDGYAAQLNQVDVGAQALDRDRLVCDHAILVVETILQQEDVSRGGVGERGLKTLAVLHDLGGGVACCAGEDEGEKEVDEWCLHGGSLAFLGTRCYARVWIPLFC